MFNPIQPNTQSTMIPMDAFPGQKLDRSQETPRPVVDRKQEIPSAREEIPREEVERAAEKLNRLMVDKRVKFKVRATSKRVIVKIVDQETGEVLEEISSQEALDRLSSFSQRGGLLFDKRV